MTDLDSEIRRTVYEWAEAAPMPPTLDHLAGAAPDRHPRRPSRGLVLAAVVVVALLVGVAVSVVAGRSQPATVQSAPAPSPATLDDVAGQSLAARYGIETPSTGYVLSAEFTRDSSLTAADDPLPTGPLGPLYAQSFNLDGADSPWSFAVVSVLPTEQDDVVLGATGHADGASIEVSGHPATFVAAWSGSDDSAVTWQDHGVAIVVVGAKELDEAALTGIAEQVGPVDGTPILPPAQQDFDPTKGEGPNLDPGSWSLAPTPPQPFWSGGPNAMVHSTGWSMLHAYEPTALALSTVLDHGTTDLGRFTVRASGHPESGAVLSPGSISTDRDGNVLWAAGGAISVQTVPIDGEPQDLVEGMGPTTIVRVRTTLSDGRTFMAPTYDVGRGWPVRIFVQPVPVIHGDPTATGLHVVRIDGLGADGELLNAGPSTLGNGIDGGMAGYEMILSCHPTDPTAFVFTDYCQGS